MKLLQWNIWYQERIQNILEVLKETNADIVCLQELTIGHECNSGLDTPKFLAEGLGFYYFFKEALCFPHAGNNCSFGNGIFSRYPILKKSFVFIQEAQNQGTEDYSKEARVYVEITVDAGEKEYTIGTVHMSYSDKLLPTAEKKTETDQLTKVLRAKNNNFIFAGDLNALPGSYTLSEISKDLISAGPDMAEKTWTTKPFSYKGFEANTLDWRLDYVFVTPDIQIKEAKIVQTQYSDHLPIFVET